MTNPAQSYPTHRRWFPLFHYVALPILLMNVVIAAAHLFRHPTLWK